MEKSDVIVIFFAYAFGIFMGLTLGRLYEPNPIKVQIEYVDNALSEGKP